VEWNETRPQPLGLLEQSLRLFFYSRLSLFDASPYLMG
jgi:hypothetical protein